jgi:patatin-like phospholipase/acyl hydrolase
MKIFCGDGGGVYGFAMARILEEAMCSDKFDAFIGTSIGSAIAAAHAMGFGGMIGQDFFDNWMPRIFHRSFFRRFNPFLSKYPDDGLVDALKYVYGGYMLGDAKKPLFITAANIGAKRLKVFSSIDAADSGLPLWKVIRYATAAETYFRPMNGYGDGGVFVNNPSMAGVASAIIELGAQSDEIEILSIGTGDGSRGNGIPHTFIGWGLWMVGAMLDGASDAMNDYFVRALARGKFVKKYERIQFPAESYWEMDSIDDMKAAEEAWEPDIIRAIKIVKEF